MPIDKGRAYTATRFVLELNGRPAGSLSAVEGGEAYADVVLETPAVDGRTKKHLGTVRYEPVKITVGVGMGQRLYNWLQGTLAGEQPERDGAIVFLDYQGKESSRLEFDGARISDIELPLLDPSDKGPAELTVTFHSKSTVRSSASAGSVYAGAGAGATKGLGGKQKAWSVNSFRFRISGLEDACKKVAKVESLAVHQPEALGSPPQPGSLSIVVPSAFVQPFQAWHEDFVIKGNNADEMERKAQLVLLSQNQKEELLTVNLENVGIVRITQERQESKAEVVSRSSIELYVEAVELADAVLADMEPEERAEDARAERETLGLAETLRELARGRERSREEPVAERLAATAAAAESVDAGGSTLRSDGVAAGEEWARRTASLSELRSLAELEAGDWTDLRLADDHSLTDELRAAGSLSADAGPVDLARDDFVEGLVAGAAGVYREVLPAVLERQDLGAAAAIPSLDLDDGGGAQAAAVDLQMILQEQQQVLHILSNISKTLHETAQATIRSLR